MTAGVGRALLLLGAILAAPAPAARVPAPFSAEYVLHVHGLPVGRMTRELVAERDGSFVFSSSSRAVGVAALVHRERIEERSRWRLHGTEVRPLRYSYRRSGGRKPRQVGVSFDWDARRIANTAGAQTWHMELEPGVLDKLLYQLVIMSDLERGLRDLSYQVADGGRIKTYRLEMDGEERLDTALGEMDTIRLVRRKDGGRRQTVLWCAPALDFLPVRVQYTDKDGAVTRVEIDSLRGLPRS